MLRFRIEGRPVGKQRPRFYRGRCRGLCERSFRLKKESGHGNVLHRRRAEGRCRCLQKWVLCEQVGGALKIGPCVIVQPPSSTAAVWSQLVMTALITKATKAMGIKRNIPKATPNATSTMNVQSSDDKNVIAICLSHCELKGYSP